MSNAIALAGLLLVFAGFVYAQGDAMSNTRRGSKYKHVARGGMAPVGVLLFAAWLSLNCIEGQASVYTAAAIAFRAGIISTALYGAVVFFVYL